ncbi:MAG: cytochrome c oxidase subunit II [Methanobacteriota archaeon]|nr:MAG: cytochrome c oxidase subunit II [Euryarchaeota archaeon]
MFNYFPETISTYGGKLDHVYWMIFYIVGFWFLLSEGVLFYFIFRYRQKKNPKATYVSGESLKMASWVLIPAAIVLALDLGIDFAGGSAFHTYTTVPPGEYAVKVTGKQFNWNFTYPGPDNQFDTEDDLTIENELHVPVNKQIRLILESQDVLHSFFIPVIRLKQDVIPGRKISVWFQAIKTSDSTENGYYEIACAELCGYGHYTMRGFLYVHSQEDYQKWVEQNWQPATEESEQAS